MIKILAEALWELVLAGSAHLHRCRRHGVSFLLNAKEQPLEALVISVGKDHIILREDDILGILEK